jgi:PAS domain S-box-containing protein
MPIQSLMRPLYIQRLTLRYCLALGTVALLAMGGQVLVQELISRQRADSSIINIAGRQRMLSQRITKAALAAARAETPDERSARTGELREALDLWTTSHEAITGTDAALHGNGTNSATVVAMFAAMEPERAGMLAACEALLARLSAGTPLSATDDALARLLANEPGFLDRMDAIVFQYEAEARARVERLRRVEWVLLSTTLVVLALEGLFIFRPAVASIRRTVARLVASEEDRAQMASELTTIFDTVPALILYHDREGRIIRVNKSGAEIIGESLYKLHLSSVYAWFPDDSRRYREEDDWIYENDQPRRDLLHYLRNSQGDVRWLRMNKAPYHDAEHRIIGIIVFAVDVTAHKRLENRLMGLRAEEQRRLGYDLHDGLGQHLSGILYLSRRLENRFRAKHAEDADSIGEIVRLVKESVTLVRSISKGLRPLNDDPHALAQALADLTAKTQESTGIACGFEEAGTVLLYDADVAENLFRIAQEAINNAVRHSGGTRIEVRLQQSDEETVLEVADNGKGLGATDWSHAHLRGQDPGGLGLGIMEHRAELMGGVLHVDSIPGTGTTIRCRLKV